MRIEQKIIDTCTIAKMRLSKGFWGFREKGYLFSGIWEKAYLFGVLGCREQGAEEKHFRELVIFLSGSREHRLPPGGGGAQRYAIRSCIAYTFKRKAKSCVSKNWLKKALFNFTIFSINAKNIVLKHRQMSVYVTFERASRRLRKCFLLYTAI